MTHSTFFGPQPKTAGYWDRERTTAGRAVNDGEDRLEQRSAYHAMVSAGMGDEVTSAIHAELWQADEADKEHWRAHFRRTGELLTPEQRHRLDEPASEDSVGAQVAREYMAALAEEYGDEAIAGAEIILPPSLGKHAARETKRAEHRFERMK